LGPSASLEIRGYSPLAPLRVIFLDAIDSVRLFLALPVSSGWATCIAFLTFFTVNRRRDADVDLRFPSFDGVPTSDLTVSFCCWRLQTPFDGHRGAHSRRFTDRETRTQRSVSVSC